MPGLLALIPARAGSKSIPGKNLAFLAGKPLIVWTIEAALGCPIIDRIVVTTDDPKIARLAISLGVEVPFLRPSHLAQDDTPGIEPVIHALDWLAVHESYYPDWVLLLQPTSPLRTSQDIQQAHQAVLESQADAIIGLTPVAHHPGWMKVIDDHGFIQDYLPLSLIPARRQDLPPVYIPNGAIYIIRRITLLESRSFVPPNTISFIMTSERSVDIDTPWDFQIAEWILQASPNHADHPDR